MNKAFEIVFDDEYLIVVDKLAKILVCPSPKKEKVTLTTLLEAKLKSKLFPCHRLDRETTGLIIYAKDRKTARYFAKQFEKKKIEKKYFALIRGKLSKKKGAITGYVLDREAKLFKERPKKAKTFYRIVEEFPHFSLIELIPITGRTNQLRIQLANISHPILGERKYAYRKDFPVNFKRLALHAYFLRFSHPISRDKIEIKVDLPSDMREFMEKFRVKKEV